MECFKTKKEFYLWRDANCNNCHKAVTFNYKLNRMPQYKCAIQRQIELQMTSGEDVTPRTFNAAQNEQCPFAKPKPIKPVSEAEKIEQRTTNIAPLQAKNIFKTNDIIHRVDRNFSSSVLDKIVQRSNDNVFKEFFLYPVILRNLIGIFIDLALIQCRAYKLSTYVKACRQLKDNRASWIQIAEQRAAGLEHLTKYVRITEHFYNTNLALFKALQLACFTAHLSEFKNDKDYEVKTLFACALNLIMLLNSQTEKTNYKIAEKTNNAGRQLRNPNIESTYQVLVDIVGEKPKTVYITQNVYNATTYEYNATSNILEALKEACKEHSLDIIQTDD